VLNELAAQQPRNFEAVCAAIGEILATLSPAECADYLRNSGYSPT